MVTERGGRTPMRPPLNIYVLAGENGLVYDAGYGTGGSLRRLADTIRRIESYCRERGEPCSIGRALPSHAHPDHFSGLAGLRERLGLRILLTRTMMDVVCTRDAYRDSYRYEGEGTGILAHLARNRLVRSAVSLFYEALYGTRFIDDPDEIIDEEGTLEIGGRRWRVIASPGHSPDHISLYEEKSGILLGGDNVLRSVTTWLGPPKSDLKIYMQTLEGIRALPGLRLILGAHGSPVENPGERIGEIIGWRRQRLEHVYEAVSCAGRAGVSKRDVVRSIYAREGHMKRFLADGWIDLSLRCLLDEGRIREVSPGRYIAPRGRSGGEEAT
ncbi:MAG: MBL fold metallo-hydrolase [Spirochaetes bacterium]|nr:MBL fold metallo-hydrolase [Spirochaetota bacterium]